MNNATLAHAIAQAQIGARGGFIVEQVNGATPGDVAPYEGAVIYRSEEDFAVLHVYLNTDDEDVPEWLVECASLLGDSDVRPLTAANLERGLQFLLSGEGTA
jgi:hypothetical protein